MKFIDRIRKCRLQGAVLFTVVSVCAVIIIFIMATLTIVASVQKRTYSDYAKSQSYYTARSAVNSVVTALNQNTDPNAAGLRSAFAGLVEDKQNRTELTLSGIPADAGTITACYVQRVTEDVYKVCATARVLDDETTVAVYLYQSTGTISDPGNANSNALTTFGMSSGACTLHYGGGTSINILDKCPSGETLKLQNTSQFLGGGVVNASVKIEAGDQIVQLEKGEGLVVYGDLRTQNDSKIYGLYNLSTAKTYGGRQLVTADGETVALKDIPYVYVTGEFSWFWSGGPVIGSYDRSAKVYCPVNVYCGTLAGTNNPAVSIHGDVYCYDEEGQSTIDMSRNFNLYGWISSLTPEDTFKSNAVNGGDLSVIETGGLYSKGDVIVKNMMNQQSLGKISVDGTLKIVGSGILSFDSLYVGALDLSEYSGKIVIGGVEKAPDAIPQICKQEDTLKDYYAALSTIDEEFTVYDAATYERFREKLVDDPEKTIKIGGVDVTYRSILNALSCVKTDHDIATMFKGYYYKDANGNGQKDENECEVYSDNPDSTYLYYENANGFIDTIASSRSNYSQKEENGAPVTQTFTENGSTYNESVYDIELFYSEDEFDKAVAAPYVSVSVNNGTPSCKMLDSTGAEMSVSDPDKYYKISGNEVTLFTNAVLQNINTSAGPLNLKIDPQAAGRDLYLKFKDCYISNKSYIVVNDVKAEGSDKQYNCFMYFCTEKDVSSAVKNSMDIYPDNCVTVTKAFIGNQYYYEKLGQTVEVEQKPTAANYREMPNIYISVQPHTNFRSGSGGGALICAYASAPRSSLDISEQPDEQKLTAKYTSGYFDESGASTSDVRTYEKVSMLGSFVFGGIQTKNVGAFLYVSDEGKDKEADAGNETHYSIWTPLYYNSK